MAEKVFFNKPMEWKSEMQNIPKSNNDEVDKRKTLMEELGLGLKLSSDDDLRSG